RLFAGRPRDRGADDLPRLRAAQARAALKGSTTMTINGWIQIALYFVVLTALVVPLGRFMARVFEGERTFLSPGLRPGESALYRAGSVNQAREQDWVTYTVAMLLFNAVGFLIVYALQRLQAVLPLNPADQSAVPSDLAFNTAVSFTSNTNWQNYGGE